MKKGIFDYYGYGWNVANETFKNISFKDKIGLLSYFLLSFIGRIIIFTRPIFEIADNNLALMMIECRTFSLDKIFEGTTNGNTYGQLLMSYVLSDLKILASLVIYLLPLAAYWGVAVLFGYAYGDNALPLLYVSIIISIIVVIILFVYVVVLKVYQEPMAYISQNNTELNTSDIMFNSTRSLEKQGKWAIFSIYFITSLIITLVVGLFLAAIYVTFFYFGVIGGFIAIALVLALLIVCVNFLPTALAAGKCALYSLIKDVSTLNKIIVVKPNRGVEESVSPLFPNNEIESKTSSLNE